LVASVFRSEFAGFLIILFEIPWPFDRSTTGFQIIDQVILLGFMHFKRFKGSLLVYESAFFQKLAIPDLAPINHSFEKELYRLSLNKDGT